MEYFEGAFLKNVERRKQNIAIHDLSTTFIKMAKFLRKASIVVFIFLSL